MFLKRKRCGKIKARGCADGRKQRIYTSKEEASSPTVSLESVLLSCVIDAQEGRDMDELVYVRINGQMAEELLKTQKCTRSALLRNGESKWFTSNC